MEERPFRPDPRPSKRGVKGNAGRAKLRKEGRCRSCGESRWALSRHHLVPRSQSGDDVDDNLVPLCLLCHDTLHNHPGQPRTEVRHAIGRSLTDAERAYVGRKMGVDYLRRHYGIEQEEAA